MTQANLFTAFLRIGLFGFGGGPTMIPLVHKEVVVRYRWLDDEEFATILAIGNALPGPIATKMAGYIGYRIGGILGCINAVIATIAPLILVMIIGLTTLNQYRDMPWVGGMAIGVIPVVAWMMVKLTWEFIQKGYQAIGLIVSASLTTITLGLIYFIGIHPGIVVAAILIFAVSKPLKPVPPSSNSATSSEDKVP